MRAYLYCSQTFSRLSRRKRLPRGVFPTIMPLCNRLRNILAESAPLVFILVPPWSSMADTSKGFSPSPWTSVRSDTEEGERRLTHTLRLDKCLYCRKAYRTWFSSASILLKWVQPTARSSEQLLSPEVRCEELGLKHRGRSPLTVCVPAL